MPEGFLIALVLGTMCVIATRLLLPRVLARRGVWMSWHTKFGPALVFDSTDADGTAIRLLNVNGTFQSVCYLADELAWLPACAYHRIWAREVRKHFGPANEAQPANEAMPSSEAQPAKRRALVMGGGGCSFPKWLVAHRPDFTCEVVEADPAIAQIARERFLVDKLIADFDIEHNGRFSLICNDAVVSLLEDTQGYDLIVNDAFAGKRPLGRLATSEGVKAIRTHLHEGGVYVGNVRTPLEGRRARTLFAAREAFERQFAHVRIIPERPEEPHAIGNNTLIAW